MSDAIVQSRSHSVADSAVSGRTLRVAEARPDTGQEPVAPRILIVDDHDVLSETLSMALRLRGLEHVTIAHDLTRAGVLAAAEAFAPDVALVDYYLGEGHTSVDMIAPLAQSGAVVLVLTGSKQLDRLAECLEAGASGLFDKSEPFDDLVELIHDAATGVTVMRPASRQALLDALQTRRADDRRRMAPFRTLTKRECEVLTGMIDGHSAQTMARNHAVSLATVRSQIRAVLRKLGVNSQLAAVALAHEADWEEGAG